MRALHAGGHDEDGAMLKELPLTGWDDACLVLRSPPDLPRLPKRHDGDWVIVIHPRRVVAVPTELHRRVVVAVQKTDVVETALTRMLVEHVAHVIV